MTTRAARIIAGALASFRTGLETYDPDKLGLGPMMVQKLGVGAEDDYVGPMPVAVIRPMEASTAIPLYFPWAMRWSQSATSQVDWVFSADIATAAATRRLGFATLNRLTGAFDYQGFITLTFPGTSEAKTIRALRMTYEKKITGTVGVTGTAVTGVGTQFVTDKACVGNRIGFGSTDPTQIATWYEIGAIASDTGLTLTTAIAATLSAGTPYVIEDLRAVLGVTSATTSNGGIYLVKGLRPELFSTIGGAVPAATTVDNIRAVYYIKDAATGTLLVNFGVGLDDKTSFSSRMLWAADTLANPVLFKFDIYAALTLTAGADTTAFKFKTGSGGAVTGTTSQHSNLRLAQAAHGPGAGLKCLYFTTTSRVYRTADVSTITAASTTWLLDSMVEIPPGSLNSYPANGAWQSLEYSSFLDKWFLTSSSTVSHLTQYRTDSGQLDRVFTENARQYDQTAADSSTPLAPYPASVGFTSWVEDGMLYIARFGTTSTLNQIYAIPLGVDWEYTDTTAARIIFPRIATPNADKYLQAFVQEVQVIGGASGKNLGMAPEPCRLRYRTTGISDNSGAWNTLDSSASLAAIAGAAYIQFAVEFRMGHCWLPSRIMNLGVLWNDLGMSDYWQMSGNIGTDLANKRFGFRHSVAYGTAVPRLKVELFDAESGASLGSDDTTTAAWTWERSTNAGGAWGAMTLTDRANADTYIRVTPTSLADNIKVRAVLREY